MRELKLLLVDLTTYGADKKLNSALGKNFLLKYPRIGDSDSKPKTSDPPNAICFEFDHPDAAGLLLLKKAKQHCPSIPIIMITRQHSEDLAIWAFRTCAWDYLVKPVSSSEVMYLHKRLSKIVPGLEGTKTIRRFNMPTLPMPMETCSHGHLSAQSSILPAALYIEDHLGSKIIEKHVAKTCNLSLFKFCRIFREVYGMTFKEYVVRKKITEASRLLKNPHASISEIAYQLGYDDPSYFTRVFKKHVGVVPSEFRAHTGGLPSTGWPMPAQLTLEQGDTSPSD